MADRDTILAVKIVTAYVAGNNVTAANVPDLIRATYAALIGSTTPMAEPAVAQQPSVSVRKSITPEAIICLDCGSSQKMLKRHLTGHGLTVDEYRAKWALASDYPMVAPNYALVRSQLAIKVGLGRKKSPAASEKSEPAGTTAKPRNHYPASRWAKPSE